MADAALDQAKKRYDLDLGADESGARPIWKHLDELEGGTPPPLSAQERADVDALLREIGTMPNPELRPPVIPSSAPPSRRGARTFGLSVLTLTVLGAVAFLLGMVATMAVLRYARASETVASLGSTKVVSERKPAVVLQLPPFTITARVPRDALPAEAEPIEETPATAAAWHPPQLAPGDAPPRVTPMGVAAPAARPQPASPEPVETVALSDATDPEIDAVIAGLAAPAPSEVLDAPTEPAQHATYTPAVPASMP